jgi:hypothetical protein
MTQKNVSKLSIVPRENYAGFPLSCLLNNEEYNIGQLTWDKSATNLRTTCEADVNYENQIMKHV